MISGISIAAYAYFHYWFDRWAGVHRMLFGFFFKWKVLVGVVAVLGGAVVKVYDWHVDKVKAVNMFATRRFVKRCDLKVAPYSLSDVCLTCPEVVCSVREYAASLDVQGRGSLGNIVYSVMESLSGYPIKNLAAIFNDFLPEIMREEGSFNDLMTVALDRDIVQLPSMILLGGLQHLGLPQYVLGGKNPKTEEQDGKSLLLKGGTPNEKIEKAVTDLKSSGSLDFFELWKLVLSQVADPKEYSYYTAERKPVHEELLPGLHFGVGSNTRTRENAGEALSNKLFAYVLNHLSANMMKEEGRTPFVIKVGEQNCDTPFKFVEAMEDAGWEFEAAISLTLTSFGMNMCVANLDPKTSTDEPFHDLMLSPIINTGIPDPYEGITLPTLATHGAISLSFRSLENNIGVQYYQGLEGYCGYHADNEWFWGYRERSRRIPTIFTVDELPLLFDLLTIYAVAVADTARAKRWTAGGYGVMGTCSDAVAFIEYALKGDTCIYPLQANPSARTEIAYMLGRYSENPEAIRLLKKALLRVPSDMCPDPRYQKERIIRMQKCFIVALEPDLFCNAEKFNEKYSRAIDFIADMEKGAI